MKIRSLFSIMALSFGQFIAGSNELGTIPETGCRFYCHAIDRGSDNESKPTDEVVYGFVLFH